MFMESWAPNSDFGQNPVFAVREQLHRFRTKPTPDSDSPKSKVPSADWNLVFFIFEIHYVRHSLWDNSCRQYPQTSVSVGETSGAECDDPAPKIPNCLQSLSSFDMLVNTC